MIELTFAPANKNMSNGMRMFGNRPLTSEEIKAVMDEITAIEADIDTFVFNNSDNYARTYYDVVADLINVGVNIFPDTRYGSTHPRDRMSIRAVLAHEYYGHRTFRKEYIADLEEHKQTTAQWEDEARASVTAARKCPNLSDRDRALLIEDAIKRAEEFGQVLKLDDFMKGVLFDGYDKVRKNIVPEICPLVFVSKESLEREIERQ